MFWHNLMKSGEGDFRTRHAGCPIISGTKWGKCNCYNFLHALPHAIQQIKMMLIVVANDASTTQHLHSTSAILDTMDYIEVSIKSSVPQEW